MAQKPKRVTLGQLGVLLTVRKKSVIRSSSSDMLTSTDSLSSKDKKGKNKKKNGSFVRNTSSTRVPNTHTEPQPIWNEEIAKLCLKDNPWKKTPVSILLRPRVPIKVKKFAVQKQKYQNTKEVLVLYAASKDTPAVPFDKTINQGIRYGNDGHILPYCILGTETDYLSQANIHGHVIKQIRTITGSIICKDDRVKSPGAGESAENIPVSVYTQHVDQGRALKFYHQSVFDRSIQRKHLSETTRRSENGLIMGDCCKQWESGNRILHFTGDTIYWQVEQSDPRDVAFWRQRVPLAEELTGLHSTLPTTEQGFPQPREIFGYPNCTIQERGCGKPLMHISDVYSVPDTLSLYVKGTNGKLSNTVKSQESQHEISTSNINPSSKNIYRENKLFIQSDGSWKGTKTIYNDCSNIPTITLTGDSLIAGPRIRLCEKEAAWCPSYDAASTVQVEAGITGPINQTLSRTLLLENCGSTVIHFGWQRMLKPDPFGLQRNRVKRFYFNDQEGILCPGESKEICMVFKSSMHGVFSEQWKLITNPTMCGHGEIILTVWGIATFEDIYKSERHSLESLLSERMSRRIVDGMVNDMMTCVRTPYQYTQYDLLIDPTGLDLFHSINKKLNYKSQLVDEILVIAGCVSSHHNFNRWTVSVLELRQMIRDMSQFDDLMSEDEENPVILEPGQNSLQMRLNHVVAEMSFCVPQAVLTDKYNICMGLLRNAVDSFSNVATALKKLYGEVCEVTVLETKVSVHEPFKPIKKPPAKDKKEKSTMKADVGHNASKHGTKTPRGTPVSEKVPKKDESPKSELVFMIKHNPVLYRKYMDKLYITCRVILTELVTNIDEHLSCMKNL